VNKKTIQQLADINKTFYQTISSEFDATRQKAWDGWLQLLPEIWKLPQDGRVLDLGCGNGRFGEFLAEYRPDLKYVGFDQDPHLLKRARQLVPKGNFLEGDILSKIDLGQIEGKFDLITAIAVLHHLPSFEKRQQVLKNLATKLSSQGLMIFTAWQFLSIEALSKRVLDWGSYPDIDQNELEPGDYLIDWQRGEHAIRYCHLIDRKEIEALIEPLHYTKVDQFFADGKEGKSNIYVVLRKA
jgi:SAM-dependent methyltransferase